jgi:hypothetical protein
MLRALRVRYTAMARYAAMLRALLVRYTAMARYAAMLRALRVRYTAVVRYVAMLRALRVRYLRVRYAAMLIEHSAAAVLGLACGRGWFAGPIYIYIYMTLT